MALNPKEVQQHSLLLQQILSAVETTALRRIGVKPYAKVITGPAVGVIPSKTKSFNIINLGLNGENLSFLDIPVVGITDLTAIPKALMVFGYSIENDQNYIDGEITVSPPADHVVVIQYLK